MTQRFQAAVVRSGLAAVVHFCSAGFGVCGSDLREAPKIQDNSFLVEEAYNQERGVVQHINTFSRQWNSKDWAYSFTQEWPGLHNWRHQFSYTLTNAHAGAHRGSGGGWGDTGLNYRYQILGDGDSRVAFAPRISVMLPTGDVTRGLGAGAPAVQMNLPVSVVLNGRLISHSNVGAAVTPSAQNAEHDRATTVGYTIAQGVIFVAHPRVNLMVEAIDSRFETVAGPGAIAWTRSTYLSPGVRWAHNFRNGLQIVPGVAVPIGVGASAGERGLFLYLSFEHPIGGAFSR